MSQNNKKHDHRHNQRCQVCWIAFRPMDKQDTLMNRIECHSCRASCHRVCYNPAGTDKEFTCDVCLDTKANKSQKAEKKCILCHNGGLLKRVGDNIYGHPVCLIRNQSTKIHMDTMEFEAEKLAPKVSTETQCSICSNPCEEEEKCVNTNCNMYGHVYCLLKSQNEQWNNMMSPPEEGKIDKEKSAYLWSTRLLCPNHSWETCICTRNQLQHTNNLSKGQLQWIMCDGCRLWIHQNCIKQSTLKKKQEKYHCQHCKTWANNLLNGVYQQTHYPKMQYHDIFYLFWRINQGKVPAHIVPLVPYNQKMIKDREVSTTKQPIEQLRQGLKRLMQRMDTLADLNKNDKQLESIMEQDQILQNSIVLLDKPRKSRKKLKPIDQLTQNIRQLIEHERYPSDETLLQFIEYREKKNRFRRAALKALNDMNKQLSQEKESIENIFTRCYNSVTKARGQFKFHNWQEPISSLVQFIKDPSITLQSSLNCIRLLLDIAKMIMQHKGQTATDQFMTRVFMSKISQDRNIIDEIKHLDGKIRDSPDMYKTNSEILQKQLQTYLSQYHAITLKQYNCLVEAVYQCYPPVALPKHIESQAHTTRLAIMRAEICLQQPLSKHNYAYLQRKLEDWTSSKVLPNQKFLRRCNSYILQCELLDKLEKYARTSEMEDPMDYQSIAVAIVSKIGLLNSHVAIDCSNELLRLGMQGIKPEGDFKIVIERLSELFLAHRQKLVSCPDPATVQELLVLCDLSGSEAYKATYQTLLQQFMAWYNKYYKPIYQMNIANRLDNLEFVQSNFNLVREGVEEGENCRTMSSKLMKVLKSAKLWMQLTMKAHHFLEIGRKITTYAAKQLNTLMKQSLYPRNKTMDSVVKLAHEAFDTDRSIERFFSKKKKCQPFGQQKVVNSKMSQGDAQKMFNDFMNGKFDIIFKYEDYIEEKKRFEKKVSHVPDIIKQRNLAEVQSYVKYFVHDCPFKYEEFKKLWEAFIQLRCQFGTPKSKQELQGLFLFAGQNSQTLKRRFQRVLSAYRQMDILIMSASQGKQSDYATLEKLQLLQGDLLRDDTTLRTTIKSWIEGYDRARHEFRYAIERGCDLASLQQRVSVFKRFPIRYAQIRQQYRQRKELYDMNISVLQQIMSIRSPFSQSLIAKCQAAINTLKSRRMLPKIAHGLQQDIEDYRNIKQFDKLPMGIDEYSQMLKICQKLNQQFATSQLNSRRMARLFEFSTFATDSASTLPFLKLYYKEVKYLRLVSSMEQKENSELAKIETTLEELITTKQATINSQNSNLEPNGQMEVQSNESEVDQMEGDQGDEGDSIEEMDDMDPDEDEGYDSDEDRPSKMSKPDEILIDSSDDK